MNRGPLIALGISAVVCVGIVVVASMARQRGVETVDGDVRPAADEPADRDPQQAEPEPADDPQRPLVVDPPAEGPDGMVWIPGGAFQMGGQDAYVQEKRDELPVHEVELDGFWMDATEVTNAEYLRFVEATGYKTYAERPHTREEYRGQVPDLSLISDKDLEPGSICFNPQFDPTLIDKSDPNWPYAVWQVVQGADWRHPHGPGTSIAGIMDHPVVHVNWEDVQAYCQWAGKRLPTEAEWEYAARGGHESWSYSWGNERNPDGPQSWRINIWQGEFPYERVVDRDAGGDGFAHTSPVRSDQFPPNDYGLYHMLGNVWEWTSDYYRPDYYFRSPIRNPPGPASSFDPNEPQIVKRVQRGGSFMCNENYCLGYRVSSRMRGDEVSGSFHCGFRCVVGWDELDAYLGAPRQQTADAGAAVLPAR